MELGYLLKQRKTWNSELGVGFGWDFHAGSVAGNGCQVQTILSQGDGRRMEIVLKVVEGTNAGQEIKISGDKFFIGRAEDCHLRPKSDLISRHHCAIMIDEGFVAIRDFGSKNGTIVNGERVIGEQELKSGDLLQVGHLKFELLLSPTLGGKPLPKVTDVKEAVARTAMRAQASSDDLDISDWLTTEDPKASTKETQQLDLWQNSTQDTIVADASGETTEGSAAPTEAHERPADGKKKPGKLPPIPKTSTNNSRDAAADTLRKLFKGR